MAGVVLASAQGRPLAHDVGMDAHALVARGLAQRRIPHLNGMPGASALVASGRSVYLVVFLPPDVAVPWGAPSGA